MPRRLARTMCLGTAQPASESQEQPWGWEPLAVACLCPLRGRGAQRSYRRTVSHAWNASGRRSPGLPECCGERVWAGGDPPARGPPPAAAAPQAGGFSVPGTKCRDRGLGREETALTLQAAAGLSSEKRCCCRTGKLREELRVLNGFRRWLY